MGRNENIIVFDDTRKHCNENINLRRATAISIARQELFLEKAVIPEVNRAVYKEPAQVIVSKKRSFEAAAAYRGQAVCVHNFASATNPGGGVIIGASAQEECLCRCSNLYFCLASQEMMEEFYGPHRRMRNPLHNDDAIYTPDITVFKTDTAAPELMPEKDWYKVNVITCAAPNLRQAPSNIYNPGDGDERIRITDDDLQALHEKRLRRILDIAVLEGNEVVILGAFGCGAFQNDPRIVAAAAQKVIADYRYAFKTIEFAVYCSTRDEQNYNVFKKIGGARC